MNKLSSKQRAYIRALAHQLSPIVYIGKEGITEQVIDSITKAFNRREVVKIKVLENAPETSLESSKIISEKLEELNLVAIIGRIIIFYREHPQNPKVVLP